MKRIFYLLMPFFLFFSILGAATALAQDEVDVKTSARDGFARVTMGWSGKDTPQYTVDESKSGEVLIKFEKAGKLDLGGADFKIFNVLRAPKIVSENPLVLSFALPEGTKVRAFDARGKVFFDVYDEKQKKVEEKKESKNEGKNESKNEGGKTQAKAGSEPVDRTAEVVKPDGKKVKLVFAPEFKQDMAKKENAKPPAVPPATVKEPEVLAGSKEAATKNQYMLAVTSTSPVDIAVFENFGQIVWVMDQNAYQLMPAIEGPKPEIFGSFASIQLPSGGAFVGRRPPDLMMKGQGGGLMWRLVLADNLQMPTPVDFEQEAKLLENEKIKGGKIIWPVKNAGMILDVPDLVTGQMLKVVTVRDANFFVGKRRSFVDFDVLNSPIGLAIRPKVDDLKIEKTERGIEISRPAGLAISSEKMAALSNLDNKGKVVDLNAGAAAKAEDDLSSLVGNNDLKTIKKPSIFRFDEWKIGGLESLNQNKNILLAGLYEEAKDKQIEDLMTLAKMHLAHGRGAEALGFLEFALMEMPELEKSPEFLALRGVARAFDWKSEIAFNDLSNPELKPYDEIAYWRAFVLADLGDWQQAAEILPQDYSYLFDYPELVADRLALSLAEVNLRAGRIKIAQDLLVLVEKNKVKTGQSMEAAIKYLKGEIGRQKGNKEETKKIWEELTQDPDDFYRARAGLALTRLLRDEKKVDNKQAIDRLEKLRYAWRGDELEAQINYWLGHAYFEAKDYVKGLTIMRDASLIAAETVLGRRIAEEMRGVYSDIFLKARLKNVSPLDAVAMYEQFNDLAPPPPDGNRLVQILAEHLVGADLLERAAKLMQNQIDYKLLGDEKVKIALRLAAIYLMDKQPKRAIRAIASAKKAIETLPPDHPDKTGRARDIALLSAKAYAQGGMGDKALAILKELPKDSAVSALRADIAWQSAYWPDAAEALNDVILNENISLTRPPSEDQSNLIMNQAIALSLANDRVALSNLREKFKDVMLQSTRANQFELITRQRRDSELVNKETLMSIMSEVDLFKNFLDSYKSGDTGENTQKTSSANAKVNDAEKVDEKEAETKAETKAETEAENETVPKG